jgi:hypothetical protein
MATTAQQTTPMVRLLRAIVIDKFFQSTLGQSSNLLERSVTLFCVGIAQIPISQQRNRGIAVPVLPSVTVDVQLIKSSMKE